MVQAATAGAIDFNRAEILDRHWWLKLRWTLDRLGDEHTIDVRKLQHAQHISVLDYTLDRRIFDMHWDGGNNAINDIFRLHFPWVDVQARDGRNYDSLVDQWRAKYGDMNDPEVRKKFNAMIDKVRQHMRKKRALAATHKSKTHDEKLRQLITNRRARRAKQQPRKRQWTLKR
jgi:hypothetical protein